LSFFKSSPLKQPSSPYPVEIIRDNWADLFIGNVRSTITGSTNLTSDKLTLCQIYRVIYFSSGFVRAVGRKNPYF